MESALELKVPPVVLFLGCGALGWLLGHWAPFVPLPNDGAWAWGHRGLMVLALALLLASQWAFHRGRTTVNPLTPSAASRLLTRGAFSLSRNPVYLAMLIVLIALSWRQGQASGLVAALVFFAWVTRWQIVPEERALADRFGDAYRQYRARVRRWI